MKTTVVIQDGRMQLVLTPEGDAEKRMIAVFSEGARGQRLDTRVDRGNFTECSGGWVRDFKDTQSLMVGLRVVQEKEREGVPTPPVPDISADLLDKAAAVFGAVASGGMFRDFTAEEGLALATWLDWHARRV